MDFSMALVAFALAFVAGLAVSVFADELVDLCRFAYEKIAALF
jgi:hypothetical protein